MTYADLAAELGQLVDSKAAAYGRSTATAADVLALLWPGGIHPSDYEDALSIARIFEKCSRLVHGRGTFGESEWQDIAGHALVGLMREREAKSSKQ